MPLRRALATRPETPPARRELLASLREAAPDGDRYAAAALRAVERRLPGIPRVILAGSESSILGTSQNHVAVRAMTDRVRGMDESIGGGNLQQAARQEEFTARAEQRADREASNREGLAALDVAS